MFNQPVLFLLLTLFFASPLPAQKSTAPVSNKPLPKTGSGTVKELYADIFQADSLLFSAFNNCDSVTYKKYFTNDLEFYHDIGGLSVGIAIELQAFREMCTRGNGIRRELVKGSLEVYPIKNYGAVEIGIHRFYHTNKGEPEKPSGTYKFIQVWQKVKNQWKISRVISYGHDDMRSD